MKSRSRLSMMCDGGQRTWDLSPRDVEAISDVLAALDGAESEVERLRARVLAIDTSRVVAASQLEALQDELRTTSAPPKETP